MITPVRPRNRVVRFARRCARRVIRFPLDRAPFEMFRRKPNHHYVPDYYGHSAYKDLDILALPTFGELAREAVAGGRTFLYYDKLYTVFQSLWNLARRPGGTRTITIADVGTFRGGGAYFMASCAEAMGVEEVRLHCFDTFDGHQLEDVRPELEPSQEAGRRMGRYRDVAADEVRRYLARFPAAVVHVGRFQDTAAEVAAESFDFAHVDVNLYEPTAFAMSFLDQRLADDGIILVDDYGSLTNPGVHRAVNEFLESHTDYVRFHLLTNQCVLVRRRPVTSDA
jgi:O-methyltransferase